MLRRYVPSGLGIDRPLIWYEGAAEATPRWLHADNQGSIVAYSDSSGDNDDIMGYDPWGLPDAANGWTGSRFRYTGQITIPQAGLYYYKARVYDPNLGRFLQTDPVGYASDVNLYAYVANQPTVLADPFGTTDCYYSAGSTGLGTWSDQGGTSLGTQSWGGTPSSISCGPGSSPTFDQPPGSKGGGANGKGPGPLTRPRDVKICAMTADQAQQALDAVHAQEWSKIGNQVAEALNPASAQVAFGVGAATAIGTGNFGQMVGPTVGLGQDVGTGYAVEGTAAATGITAVEASTGAAGYVAQAVIQTFGALYSAPTDLDRALTEQVYAASMGQAHC